MVQLNSISFLFVVKLLLLNHVMVMGFFLDLEKCNLTAGAFVVYHMQHDNENKIGFIVLFWYPCGPGSQLELTQILPYHND